jgi:hypothetical protein
VSRDRLSSRSDDFVETTLLRSVRDSRWHSVPLLMSLWFLLYSVEAIQWNADLGLKHALVASREELANLPAHQRFAAGDYVVLFADAQVVSALTHAELSFHWAIAPLPRGKAGS